MEEELVDAVKVIADQIPSISTVLILMSSAGGSWFLELPSISNDKVIKI